MLSRVRHDEIMPPAHDGVVLDFLEDEFFQRESDQGDHHDSGHHRVGVEKLRARRKSASRGPTARLRASRPATRMRQACARPEPQTCENVGQRAG